VTAGGPRSVALVLGTSAGGVGRHVRSLAEQLLHAGLDIVVAGPASTEAMFGFGAAGAAFVPVPIGRPGTELLAVPALRRAVRGVDLVHAHGLRAGLAAALTGRRPLVVTLHNAVLGTGLSRRTLAAGEWVVARRADLILAVSPDLVRRARDLGARDVRFVPVGAPRLAPARDAAELRTELGLEDQPLVVAVGRLHPQKAPELLIEAATRWRTLHPTPAVVLVGDGPLRAQLEERIGTSGAPVRLLGHRTDRADLLAAADVVVLASRWEGWPLVLSEALQLGRPVVATAVGGVPELAGSGAVLIPAGDVDALDGAVRQLLADPGRRAEWAERAAARAAQLPTEADTANQVRRVYAELTGRR
jgi:glycosyltransferase involved in cell wall biosynthesis